jgi:hypothetical protein
MAKTTPLTLVTADGRAYGAPMAGESGQDYERRLGLVGCRVYPRICCLETATLHVDDHHRRQKWCLMCGTLDLG